jgi:hypothetical protein
MKKQQVDHVLRAAGEITGEKQFIIIGSQSLHGKYPDVPDEILLSAEVDLIAKNNLEKTESLNFIHDLAIAKYVARREKDIVFTRALAARGMVEKPKLFELLAKTPIDAEARERIKKFIENDFAAVGGDTGVVFGAVLVEATRTIRP